MSLPGSWKDDPGRVKMGGPHRSDAELRRILFTPVSQAGYVAKAPNGPIAPSCNQEVYEPLTGSRDNSGQLVLSGLNALFPLSSDRAKGSFE